MNAIRLFNKSLLTPLSRLQNMVQRNTSENTIVDPPDNPKITIPKPKERPNETVEQRRARLLYQSRKRGMLENDLLLSTFVAKYLDNFSEHQLNEYDKLINGPSNDWDIYYWATEIKPTPTEYEHGVMKLLKEHCKNLNRESRIRQPDLK